MKALATWQCPAPLSRYSGRRSMGWTRNTAMHAVGLKPRTSRPRCPGSSSRTNGWIPCQPEFALHCSTVSSYCTAATLGPQVIPDPAHLHPRGSPARPASTCSLPRLPSPRAPRPPTRRRHTTSTPRGCTYLRQPIMLLRPPPFWPTRRPAPRGRCWRQRRRRGWWTWERSPRHRMHMQPPRRGWTQTAC